MNKEDMYYAVLVIVLVLTVSFTVYSLVSGNEYKRALNAEDKSDICKTPTGYTDEQWREHMGHHPDRYAECLSN